MYSINANNCGLRPLVSGRTILKIVGGVQATNGDWPWQIIMFYNGGFTCGGSVINSMWVITAGKYSYLRKNFILNTCIQLHTPSQKHQGNSERTIWDGSCNILKFF
jgi:secreted trypsin-like serine protease